MAFTSKPSHGFWYFPGRETCGRCVSVKVYQDVYTTMIRILSTISIVIVIVLIVASFGPTTLSSAPNIDLDIEESDFRSINLPSQRGFLMGFTYQPYDWNDDAFSETSRLIHENGDLITIFDDTGIPWPEAFAGKSYHPNVLQKLKMNQAAIKPGQTVAVVSSALGIDRVTLAGYAGATEPMERPGVWKTRDFDNAEVVTAYLNYANDLISRYQPQYFCYLAEVNAVLVDVNSAAFEKVKRFAAKVYPALKSAHPELSVCIEFMLGNATYMQERRAVAQALLPYTDLFPVSTYPFHEDSVAGDARKIPVDWFSNLTSHAGNKRFAILETSFAAENFFHPTLGIKVAGRSDRLLIPGGKKSQAIYVRRVLEEAHALNAEFVNFWTVRDTDRLHELIQLSDNTFSDPMWKLTQDTGLFDETGEPRPALSVWRQWLLLPRKQVKR